VGRCRSPSSRSLAALAAAVVRISRLPTILANNYSIHRSGKARVLQGAKHTLQTIPLGLIFKRIARYPMFGTTLTLHVTPSCHDLVASLRRFFDRVADVAIPLPISPRLGANP
jgi:hypothetical protein